MKKFFDEPELNVTTITVEDVITASDGEGDVDPGSGGLPVIP